jgi:hypothetical protein
MKKLLMLGAFTTALMAGGVRAADFNFSYTFGDGSAVTGSLSGDLNGSFVENVSNIHVSFNGVEFSGAPLYAASWNTATLDWDSAPAKISTDASQNNFIFADSNVPADFGVTNYFYFTNDATNGQTVFANNLNSDAIAYDSPATGTWSLTPAAVPLPGAVWFFTSSLGAMAALRRRRQA